MEPIVIKGTNGRTLEIHAPFGAGGIYHIFLDKFFQGMIVPQAGELVPKLNPNAALSADDITIILEKIKAVG